MPSQSSPSPPDPSDRPADPVSSGEEVSPLPSPAAPTATESSEELDIEQTLRSVEQSLLQLKARYAQIQTDRQRQADLQDQKNQIERQLQYNRSVSAQRELKQELKHLKQQLEDLEVALESQLFSWSGVREIFWQAARFGGLGFVLGWVLKSFVG